MVNEDQLSILRQGVEAWNKWRTENPNGYVDLSGADLNGATLNGANLSESDLSKATLNGANLSESDLSRANLFEAYLSLADLRGANLRGAYFGGAHLSGANLEGTNLEETKLGGADLGAAHLSGANLEETDLEEASLNGADLSGANLGGAILLWADLGGANLSGANLRGANLGRANLSKANLTDADLSAANLSLASLIETTIVGTKFTGCRIYGISVWGLKLDDKSAQKDLVITPDDQPIVTVDNIEVAQFVYLLLHNEKIRGVIDTIGKKAVLILGRFTPERKAILDALRKELRNKDYLPILFDFDKPTTKDFTETIRILAGMSLFVIADISNPKSSPLELQATVPDYMVPFVPIIQKGEAPFSMFKDIYIKYKKWVLEPLEYESLDALIEALDEEIIEPALKVHSELLAEKAAEMPRRRIGGSKKN